MPTGSVLIGWAETDEPCEEPLGSAMTSNSRVPIPATLAELMPGPCEPGRFSDCAQAAIRGHRWGHGWGRSGALHRWGTYS